MPTTTNKQQQILDELAAIPRDAAGRLQAESVVEFAEHHPGSALHDEFEWDDSEAARRFRLAQARKIIRVRVQHIPGTRIDVPVYVSLKSDRVTGGGYRLLVDVMSDEDRREELLKQAAAEMQTFRRKYRALTELAPVLDQMRIMGDAIYRRRTKKDKKKK